MSILASWSLASPANAQEGRAGSRRRGPDVIFVAPPGFTFFDETDEAPDPPAPAPPPRRYVVSAATLEARRRAAWADLALGVSLTAASGVLFVVGTSALVASCHSDVVYECSVGGDGAGLALGVLSVLVGAVGGIAGLRFTFPALGRIETVDRELRHRDTDRARREVALDVGVRGLLLRF